MAGTRKLAAMLAADVVGYSRLAGCDEDRIRRGCARSVANGAGVMRGISD